MSLYDGVGIDSSKDKSESIAGWSSGIKLLQSQLQLKKATLTQQAKREFRKGTVLAPVVDLKSRRDELEDVPLSQQLPFIQPESKGSSGYNDPEWNVKDLYDPMFPNDYEKLMRDKREKREREREEDRKRDVEDRWKRTNERYRERDDDNSTRRPSMGGGRQAEEEEEQQHDRQRRPANMGAAIAPPPSLLESEKPDNSGTPTRPPPNLMGKIGGSVAAKIMAKYGFKQGQGLGRLEQGMSQALQVEKTSKRGGKIIHEKDVVLREPSPPPPPLLSFQQPPPPKQSPASSNQKPSLADAMKNPSKVVLLRNMVGPGDVDDDLEPEVKEECSKYGPVDKVLIFEIQSGPDDEAVRIFIEFKRMESAIKAVIDLNGRYFGGRIVKAGFYNQDRFKRLDLMD